MTRNLEDEAPEELWRRAEALEAAGYKDAAKAMRKQANKNWDILHGYFDGEELPRSRRDYLSSREYAQ